MTVDYPWNGMIEYFTKNWTNRNIWKIKDFGYEFNDLLHNAYLTFIKCKNTGSKPKTIQEFIAYYKIALERMVNFISIEERKIREQVSYLEDNEMLYDELTVDDGCSLTNIDIIFAPEHIKKAIIRILERADSGEEINNKLICSDLGINHKRNNIFKEVLSYLRGK